MVRGSSHRAWQMFPKTELDLPYEQRLAKTKLWSLDDRRTRADLVEVYKNNNSWIVNCQV